MQTNFDTPHSMTKRNLTATTVTLGTFFFFFFLWDGFDRTGTHSFICGVVLAKTTSNIASHKIFIPASDTPFQAVFATFTSSVQTIGASNKKGSWTKLSRDYSVGPCTWQSPWHAYSRECWHLWRRPLGGAAYRFVQTDISKSSPSMGRTEHIIILSGFKELFCTNVSCITRKIARQINLSIRWSFFFLFDISVITRFQLNEVVCNLLNKGAYIYYNKKKSH